MQPINRSYPDWHYTLYSDLQKGVKMQVCSARYSVSEAQIVGIFYAVCREAKGLPPLPVEPSVLKACDQRVFDMEIDDEPDDTPK